MKYLILIVLAVTFVFGQESVQKVQDVKPSAAAEEKKKEPEKTKELKQFSPEDKDEMRNAEADTLQLTVQYQGLTLQAIQVKAALEASQVTQKRLWVRMMSKYGIDEKKEILCEGPSGPACKDVKPHDLVRKANTQ